MRTQGTTTTDEGITWYYEQEGAGPDIVLIPDGLGECQMFDKPMSLIAASGFRVTTFDMPGMSRSSNAPRETYEDITAQKLASYVISIIDKLDIKTAIFWGCSSGGSTVLALVAEYPERVQTALAHEVPLHHIGSLSAIQDLGSDAAISTALAAAVPAGNCGDMEAWFGLGGDTHARLWRNYPRWARGYPRTIPSSAPTDREHLTKRPLYWTVGASTPTSNFFDNIVVAVQAGIDIGQLPGMHFPYVSHPEAFVKHVVDIARKNL